MAVAAPVEACSGVPTVRPLQVPERVTGTGEHEKLSLPTVVVQRIVGILPTVVPKGAV